MEVGSQMAVVHAASVDYVCFRVFTRAEIGGSLQAQRDRTQRSGGGELIRLVASALRARGVDPAGVLARAGLGPIDAGGSRRPMLASATHRLIELAAEAAGDPAFGLSLVEQVDPRAWGLFFYLVGSATTVREALSLAACHLRLINRSVEPILTFEPDGSAVWENRYVDLRRSELKHSIEFSSAFMTRLFQSFAGRGFRHTLVTFEHARTTELDAFERFFGCPVTFGAARDRVTFPKETLDLPLLTADGAMHRTLERLARTAGSARPRQPASYRARVEAALLPRLAGGAISIDAVAVEFGISARSLTRRLAGEDTTFSAALDDLRRRLSVDYFARPDLAVGQIAHLLGYDDPGAFSIAFRRWTGVAPSQARADPAALGRLAAPSTQAGQAGFPKSGGRFSDQNPAKSKESNQDLVGLPTRS